MEEMLYRWADSLHGIGEQTPKDVVVTMIDNNDNGNDNNSNNNLLLDWFDWTGISDTDWRFEIVLFHSTTKIMWWVCILRRPFALLKNW